MVAPGNFTVTSDAGHVIKFEAGKPKYVPGVMVRACRQYGCVEKKRFSDTEAEIPSYVAKVSTSIQAIPQSPDMEAVEEVTLTSLQEEQDAEGGEEAERYTAKENRVRTVINSLMVAGDKNAFTAEGIPKTQAVNKALDEFSIGAETRDEIWAKMNRFGEVPADWYPDEADG